MNNIKIELIISRELMLITQANQNSATFATIGTFETKV